MKTPAFIIAFIVLGISAKAQYVSLSKSELKSLHTAIDTSNVYKKVFNPFLVNAIKSLTETPNPIESIRSEGLLEGNPAKAASLKALQDADKIYSMALVYRLTGQKIYLEKAIDFLLAWAKINKASGDPIDETKLEGIITGYDLVRDYVTTENKSAIDEWMDCVADAELNSKSSKPGRATAINNWNSHRIKIITLIAYTLHISKYDKFIISELEKQLTVNLNPDGTTYDFIERDAFHYHTYDLEPLLTACIVIYRATGKNYFNYQTEKGASLKKSVDFMIPYITGEKTHVEFVNSTVPFDKARAKNNEKNFKPGTQFNPLSGMYALSLASYFDPTYINVIKQAERNGSYFNWQLALNMIKKPAQPN